MFSAQKVDIWPQIKIWCQSLALREGNFDHFEGQTSCFLGVFEMGGGGEAQHLTLSFGVPRMSSHKTNPEDFDLLFYLSTLSFQSIGGIYIYDYSATPTLLYMVFIPRGGAIFSGPLWGPNLMLLLFYISSREKFFDLKNL